MEKSVLERQHGQILVENKNKVCYNDSRNIIRKYVKWESEHEGCNISGRVWHENQ